MYTLPVAPDMGWWTMQKSAKKHFTTSREWRIMKHDLDNPTVGASVNKKENTNMKKNMKNTKAVKAVTEKTLVKPSASYTKDEVRSILKLSKGTALTRRPGMAGRGKIAGQAVIAYLENAKRVKVGRRYASGAVTVVAR